MEDKLGNDIIEDIMRSILHILINTNNYLSTNMIYYNYDSSMVSSWDIPMVRIWNKIEADIRTDIINSIKDAIERLNENGR